MWSLLLQTKTGEMYQSSCFKIKRLILFLSLFFFTFSSDSFSSLFSSCLAGDNIKTTTKGKTLVFVFARGLVVERQVEVGVKVERDDKSESEKERNLRRRGEMNSVNQEEQIHMKPTVRLIEANISKEEEEKKIDKLLNSMTLEEKIGQMTQLAAEAVYEMNGPKIKLDESKFRDLIKNKHVGSIFDSPYHSPEQVNESPGGYTASEWKEVIERMQEITLEEDELPIIYGIDSIHGASYTYNTTLFPQQINVGASLDKELTFTMGKITANETYAGGLPWIFSPVLDVALAPTWARVWETFGESPHIIGELGAQYIEGVQSFGKVCILYLYLYLYLYSIFLILYLSLQQQIH